MCFPYISRRGLKALFINAMNFFELAAEHFDGPPHGRIVLENPARLDLFELRLAAAPAHLLDDRHEYGAARGAVLQFLARAEQQRAFRSCIYGCESAE